MMSHMLLAETANPGLLLGFLLVAALAGGLAARSFHVPRVVGYLIGGLALRIGSNMIFGHEAEVHAPIDIDRSAKLLRPLSDLALGIILFTIGGVFDRAHMRRIGTSVLKIGVAEMAAVFIAVFACCTAAAWLTSGTLTAQTLSLCLLLSLAALATAPAATLLVLQEYGARGPVTDTIMSLTGFNNAVCIVLFYSVFLVLESTGQLGGSLAGPPHQLALSLVCATVGSVALGIAGAVVLSLLHAMAPAKQTLLVLLAILLMFGAGSHWLSDHWGITISPLLACLVMGGVFANIGVEPQKLETELGIVAAPVMIAFFGLAGFNLHYEELRHIGWIGAAYVTARLLGKIIGSSMGVRWAKAPPRADGRLGSALLCQAAVVIGLTAYVHHRWHSPLAAQFGSVILGSVVVFEFIGPLLVRRCVVLSGEVKAISLIGHSDGKSGIGSAINLTVGAALRLFGAVRATRPTTNGPLTARHIMRTNVQFVRDAQPFDEVLQFIERSTHSHFPVVHEDGSFAGVIHFSDIRDVLYDPALRGLVTAIDLADANAPIVTPQTELAQLKTIFDDHDVGILIVVETLEQRRVIGVVEQRDFLPAHVRFGEKATLSDR